MNAKLILEDGTEMAAESFGAQKGSAGEVVFSTGMMGYPESLTDPSYKGQILILTYPLVGNYGVPEKVFWESDKIMVQGLIVSHYIDSPSHFQSHKTLADWFKDEGLPLIQIKDTRLLTQKTRDKGSMLGKIVFDQDLPWYDPNLENLVAQVSTKQIQVQKSMRAQAPIILLIDCGAKLNIQRALRKRDVTVITVPWDFNAFTKEGGERLESVFQEQGITPHKKDAFFDGILISNGPGNPIQAEKTIVTIQSALKTNIPILGICLGHQLLSLAAGGDTKKLKFGHRSQNQPCTMDNTPRCYITTQNHGFAVNKIPQGFKAWFTNANDNSNEGIIHTKRPVMSVQFHPEATPGPVDTEWIFDYFLKKI